MPYSYKEGVRPAETAFEATGATREEVFKASCDAVVDLMVEDRGSISPVHRFNIAARDESLEMLLFKLLSELIYFKNTEKMILRVTAIRIQENSHYMADAKVEGEHIDPLRHKLRADVKLVDTAGFSLARVPSGGWKSFVPLDI